MSPRFFSRKDFESPCKLIGSISLLLLICIWNERSVLSWLIDYWWYWLHIWLLFDSVFQYQLFPSNVLQYTSFHTNIYHLQHYICWQDEERDHAYTSAPQKHRCVGSKKLGCPAAIYLREVVSFPEYKVSAAKTYSPYCLMSDETSANHIYLALSHRLQVQFKPL